MEQTTVVAKPGKKACSPSYYVMHWLTDRSLSKAPTVGQGIGEVFILLFVYGYFFRDLNGPRDWPREIHTIGYIHI